jgi:hypothetical protein
MPIVGGGRLLPGERLRRLALCLTPILDVGRLACPHLGNQARGSVFRIEADPSVWKVLPGTLAPRTFGLPPEKPPWRRLVRLPKRVRVHV